MENDLEKIEICKGNNFLIIEHAVDNLIEWLTRFKEKEVNLGHKITDRSDITLTNEMTAGICPLCQKEIKGDNISHIKEIRGLF
jgi:RNase P subunit RPR2